jgi:hypothetical protein
MKKHRPDYPPHTNYTLNPNSYIMQWHFMNSVRIFCAAVSVIGAVTEPF